MLTAVLRLWAGRARVCTRGRPNYLLVRVRGRRAPFIALVPLAAARSILEDAAWMGGIVVKVGAWRRRMERRTRVRLNWAGLADALPCLLRFQAPFTMVEIRDGKEHVLVELI